MNDKRSYTEYTVITATTDFVIGFDDYDDITKDTIVVTVNGVLAESQGYAVMRKNAQVVTITPAVQSGTVRLTRVTDIDESFHQFTAGALFSAKSVDENFQQVRHSQQEVRDGFVFLEYNTNGIVQASKEATAQAKAATVEATASAVRAESAADTAVQAVGSLQGVVDAATAATATATTAASQATAATTSAQDAAQAANTAKKEATTATANAKAATVDSLAVTGRANEAAAATESAIEDAKDLVGFVTSNILYTAQNVQSGKQVRIPSTVSHVRTQAFDSVKGGARYVRSTLTEVTKYPTVAWFKSLDGAYWLLDESNPTPEMFGAEGDLEYVLVNKGDMQGLNSDTYGHRFLSGTNDINALNAAMRYAKIHGADKVTANGSYYVRSYNRQGTDGVNRNFTIDYDYYDSSTIIVHTYDSTGDADLVDPTTAQRADAQHYIYNSSEYTVSGNTVTLNTPPKAGLQLEVCQTFTVDGTLEVNGTLWTQYALPSQGVLVTTSHSNYRANLTIGQYSYNGYKPSNNGQYGTVICVGTGFMLHYDHHFVEDVHVKSHLIRAARVRTEAEYGVAFQDSDSSQLCIGIGNIYDVHFEVDPYDAATNTTSLMLCLLHWGGKYTAPEGAEAPDKGIYPIEKTWHPENCKLTVKRPLLNSQHGFFKGFELASTINCEVSDITVDGLTHIYWCGVGDVGGAYAQGAQFGRTNTGNRMGHITGFNMDVGSEYYAVLFKGEGTSKFEHYQGTEAFLQRQEVMDLTVKSHTIHCNSGNEVIRLRGVRGRVDMGVCRLFGCPRSFYILSGTGKLIIDIAESDGVVRCQNFKGLTLKRTNIDLGNSSNSGASGLYEKGYASQNCTVYLQGSIATTTTTTSLVVGATVLPINSFTGSLDIISPNDLLVIKSGSTVIEVRATTFSVKGALFIPITPVPTAIATGATVTLNNLVQADYINMTSKSSEYGLYAENAIIKELDFSDMGWSGRHSAKLYNTQATIVGRLPSSDARRLSASSDQAIWADYKCRLVGNNLYVPASSDGDGSVFLQTNAGEGATIVLNGGVVENPSTFAPSAAYPMNQIHFNGVVDKLGQLAIPRGRTGSNANGYWVKHADGSMECWARNVIIGDAQPYVWTFPTPFIDTASTFVNATATSGTTSRVGAAISTSATQANIWLVDNTDTTSGTPSVAIAGMNLYAKGYWKLPT